MQGYVPLEAVEVEFVTVVVLEFVVFTTVEFPVKEKKLSNPTPRTVC